MGKLVGLVNELNFVTKGDEYQVIEEGKIGYLIKNDDDLFCCLSKNPKSDSYFGKWFEVKDDSPVKIAEITVKAWKNPDGRMIIETSNENGSFPSHKLSDIEFEVLEKVINANRKDTDTRYVITVEKIMNYLSTLQSKHMKAVVYDSDKDSEFDILEMQVVKNEVTDEPELSFLI